jgi:hypothetical protein
MQDAGQEAGVGKALRVQLNCPAWDDAFGEPKVADQSAVRQEKGGSEAELAQASGEACGN